ncbi:MAG TPA: GNAT family N-acetyltransferase [Pleomorphomonadaceae bacterium]|nr:GNAT family N-acetyltransferase [Pleomorphomonadaceae bacterium]
MADDLRPVESERLSMPLLTAGRMERLLAGDAASVGLEIGAPIPDWWVSHASLMQFRLNQIGEEPASEPWLLRPIVLRDGAGGPVVIGFLNFHGTPDDRGFAEVGYEVHLDYRGQGYAIEAVRAMFDWAAREHDVHRFRASISPGNERSENLVHKLGMTHVGAQWDDPDGLELIYTVERWGLAN